jgi:hypothetical protein
MAEAEHMAAATGTREALWMNILCMDLGLPMTRVQLLCDNQACINLCKIIKNPISSVKFKLFQIDEVQRFGMHA